MPVKDSGGSLRRGRQGRNSCERSVKPVQCRRGHGAFVNSTLQLVVQRADHSARESWVSTGFACEVNYVTRPFEHRAKCQPDNLTSARTFEQLFKRVDGLTRHRIHQR